MTVPESRLLACRTLGDTQVWFVLQFSKIRIGNAYGGDGYLMT